MSAVVTIYTTRFCPYCMAARSLLDAKGVDYDEVPVDGNPALRQEMTARAGQHTVPQIWINEEHVGGYTELAALEQRGKLDSLLAGG